MFLYNETKKFSQYFDISIFIQKHEQYLNIMCVYQLCLINV